VTGLESPTKLLLLLVIVVFLFGAKRLPGIARSLGSGAKEAKDSVEGLRPRELLGIDPADDPDERLSTD
jgi:TatA/E family protein of Tat protein translocase